MRQIIFDTETTGLDPAQGHRIVEIGCVEIVNRVVTGRNLHIYLNPDRDSDPEALAVHGLTTEFLSDKPRFGDVADQFISFIEGAELIAHNAGFDVKFFNAELQKIGRKSIDSYCDSVIDSLAHARTLYPGKRNSLDALCDRYGISNAHRTLHGALLDSQLLAEVWLAMTRGQDAQFDASVLPVIAAAGEDLAEHEAYLAALDKAVGGACLWRGLEPAAEAAGQAV